MNKIKQNKTVIILLFVLVTVVWGAGFPLVKLTINHGVPELFIMAVRFTVAALSLIAIRGAGARNLRFSSSVVKRGSVLGVMLFLGFAFQSFGLAMTTPAKSGILTGCYVVMVPLLLLFFTRKFALKPLVDALICLFGMLVFFNVFDSFSNIGVGDALTLAGSLMFAVHMIFLEKFSQGLDALDLSIFQMISCAVCSIAASLIFEIDAYAAMDWRFMLASCIFLGIFSTGFAYLIQTLAQKNFSATTVSMVACLEAVFATVISLLLGMETITYSLVLGGAFIIFSVLRAVMLPAVTYDKFL